MITLTFDKNTATQRQIGLTSYIERLATETFNGSYSVVVNKSEDIPTYDNFDGNFDFETIDLVNSDGIKLPVSGTYNHISDFSTTYDDTTKRFNLNISLEWKELGGEPNE